MGAVTWAEASARLGRNDMPYALVTNWWDMDDEQRRIGLSRTWIMAEWPLAHAEQDLWVNLFQQVTDEGVYLHDEKLEPIASLPIRKTLWRAATEDRATGMSWTDDKDRAVWFANRLGKQPIWEIEIAPEFGEVLARFTGRNESEWVLNLDGWTVDHLKKIG